MLGKSLPTRVSPSEVSRRPRCMMTVNPGGFSRMAAASAETVYRVVNLVLSACALAVAALIVVEIEHRRTRKLDPLGVAFCAVFLTIGVRAAVRVAVNDVA